MDSMYQFAQLAAASAPAITLIALNVALLLAGEEDTLLLPAIRAYPSLELEDSFQVVHARETPRCEAVETAETLSEDLRLAA